MRPEPLTTGLSAVILHYNRPWSLELAVASLRKALAGSSLPFEIIVADDGSDVRLRTFLEQLPIEQLYIQPCPRNDGRGTTVYNTLQTAYQIARFPYLLFLEDDFWYLPQGFDDVGKNHQPGLQVVPDYSAVYRPLKGALSLLGNIPEAHFVELARSFNNPRYPGLPATERAFGGVLFRAKLRQTEMPWYTCAWPHIMRTADALEVPMPVGLPVWSAELEMTQARDRVFGAGAWVYNAERSFFAHVNIFTWREIYKSNGDPLPEYMPWSGVQTPEALPHAFKHVPGLNHLLLDAFVQGRLRNDLDDFSRRSFLDYIYHHIYRKVMG